MQDLVWKKANGYQHYILLWEKRRLLFLLVDRQPHKTHKVVEHAPQNPPSTALSFSLHTRHVDVCPTLIKPHIQLLTIIPMLLPSISMREKRKEKKSR